MSKTAEEILFIRNQAITALELTKGFTPEQRNVLSNSLKTVEEFAGYILELTAAAQEVAAYKERIKSEIGERITNDNHDSCAQAFDSGLHTALTIIDTVK